MLRIRRITDMHNTIHVPSQVDSNWFKHGSASSLENAVFVDLVMYRQSVHQCKYMPLSLEQSRLARNVAPKERRLHVEMSRPMLPKCFYLMLSGCVRMVTIQINEIRKHIESSFRRIHGQKIAIDYLT
jgi:hypothetical protein